jgi:glycosyltransferase involved in cell wall biosynthesis
LVTISLCMIVKNEADILRRCLASIADLMDEIVIVDTGSTDRTKEIAAEFTDRIYDYVWQEDFAAARNFAFSKATMEYIYSADADEVVDYFNHKRFAELKQALLPEIEIVQMHYITPPQYNTTANFKKEYRPKLYRRLRSFVWIDAVHETVRLDPVVYDSDIEIKHLPRSLHAERDFKLFGCVFEREGSLSAKLHSMYVKELYVSGKEEDFVEAADILGHTLKMPEASFDMKREAICALCRLHRLKGDTGRFFSLAFKLMPSAICAELCYEVGSYFKDQEDYEEAVQWFELAAYQAEPVIDVRAGGILPLLELGECCRALSRRIGGGNQEHEGQVQFYLEAAEKYEKEAAGWDMPDN